MRNFTRIHDKKPIQQMFSRTIKRSISNSTYLLSETSAALTIGQTVIQTEMVDLKLCTFSHHLPGKDDIKIHVYYGAIQKNVYRNYPRCYPLKQLTVTELHKITAEKF